MGMIIAGFRWVNPDDKEDEPHLVAELMCVRCFKRWIGVFHYQTAYKDIECPQCHQQGYVIGTGQPLFEEGEEE